jgi:hypothetical protein
MLQNYIHLLFYGYMFYSDIQFYITPVMYLFKIAKYVRSRKREPKETIIIQSQTDEDFVHITHRQK